MATLEERLLAKAERQQNGCLHWTGYVSTSSGYGYINVNRSPTTVHRVAFTTWVAEPAGDVDHECHNQDTTCAGGSTCLHRRCMEPTHLRDAPRHENLRAGRPPGPKPSSLTHCKHNHEYTPENTIHTHNRGRSCRACARDRSERWRARQP